MELQLITLRLKVANMMQNDIRNIFRVILGYFGNRFRFRVLVSVPVPVPGFSDTVRGGSVPHAYKWRVPHCRVTPQAIEVSVRLPINDLAGSTNRHSTARVEPAIL